MCIRFYRPTCILECSRLDSGEGGEVVTQECICCALFKNVVAKKRRRRKKRKIKQKNVIA